MPGPLILLLSVFLPACQDNETAISRGDRLWADSSYAAALAEYRLAAAQRDDRDALLRLAHAFARTGEIDDTRRVYDRLLEQAPELAGQAAWDYLRIADRYLRRGDEFGAAAAVDAALALRPELTIPDAALEVARYHRERGDAERALAYYTRALASLPPDSSLRVLYEVGLLNEELDRCDVAVDYLRAFREQAERLNPRRWRSLLTEARWHTGSCSFRLAQQAREAGDVTDALDHYTTMIALGEPENLLDQAYLERGELLYAIGRYDQALASFRRVLERNPSRTGQLVERAQRRIDDIRFGVMPDSSVPGGPPGPGTLRPDTSR